VSVQLGDRVRRDQALAEVYSPEVAEAQTQYVSARAMLEAHDQELRRTQKLVEIGAASRQELERIHAEHAAQSAGVESARARLQLLGVSTAAVKDAESRHTANATTAVPAPIDGIIVERQANVGLNVDPASKLFTVVDLSNVWVIANLYEQDFSRVSVGSEVTVTTSAYPGKALAGRVSYIDPQVSGDTRTAKLRVEVSNPRHELRLGMYADVVVSVADATTPSAMIPRAAVQTVGDRYVVYLVDQRQPSKFREREVRVGEVSGDQIEISAGVQPGDLIVSEGSFFLRAERDRLGLRSSSGATRTVPNDRLDARAADAEKPALQTARVVVDENGFTPSHLMLRAGTPARITFVRTTDNTCATEIAFPSMKIKRVLPLNQPVVIEITPTKESLTFTCGMEMFKGTVTIE
jgi:RND family efflux transporter MFP subunit